MPTFLSSPRHGLQSTDRQGPASAAQAEAHVAPLAALVMLRAGLRVLLSSGSGVLFTTDPFAGSWPVVAQCSLVPTHAPPDASRHLQTPATLATLALLLHLPVRIHFPPKHVRPPAVLPSLIWQSACVAGLSGDTDVEVLSEGWDEVTAGGIPTTPSRPFRARSHLRQLDPTSARCGMRSPYEDTACVRLRRGGMCTGQGTRRWDGALTPKRCEFPT